MSNDFGDSDWPSDLFVWTVAVCGMVLVGLLVFSCVWGIATAVSQ